MRLVSITLQVDDFISNQEMLDEIQEVGIKVLTIETLHDIPSCENKPTKQKENTKQNEQ